MSRDGAGFVRIVCCLSCVAGVVVGGVRGVAWICEMRVRVVKEGWGVLEW